MKDNRTITASRYEQLVSEKAGYCRFCKRITRTVGDPTDCGLECPHCRRNTVYSIQLAVHLLEEVRKTK